MKCAVGIAKFWFYEKRIVIICSVVFDSFCYIM